MKKVGFVCRCFSGHLINFCPLCTQVSRFPWAVDTMVSFENEEKHEVAIEMVSRAEGDAGCGRAQG